MTTYLAQMYCFECGRCRPVAEMDFASPGKKRKACSDCRARIDREREKVRQRTKGVRP